MINTKYGFAVDEAIVATDHKRLINQLWKIIPMRENEEDWKTQLQSVIVELVGLNEIFKEELNYSILLSKLEGLFTLEDFRVYRKIVFEALTLLGELSNE